MQEAIDRISMRRRKFVIGALGIAVSGLAPAAYAATWPDRPIKLVVGFAPGGTADGSARILANELHHRLGQAVLVDNRPGVSGIVGTQLVANAPPDGYTLTVGTINTHAVNQYFYKNLGYDPVKQFVPVALLGVTANVLVVPAGSRFTSVQDVIAEARANPGKLNYGTSGMGTSQNLAGELFQVMGNLKLTQVPYKGGSSALSDLLGGSIDMIFETETAARELVAAGKLRALCVTSNSPSPNLPGIPPLASLPGFEGFETQSWTGLFAPHGTPPEIVGRLGRDTVAVMAMPQVQKSMASNGMKTIGTGPAEFARFQAQEIAKWGDIVRRARIEPQ